MTSLYYKGNLQTANLKHSQIYNNKDNKQALTAESTSSAKTQGVVSNFRNNLIANKIFSSKSNSTQSKIYQHKIKKQFLNNYDDDDDYEDDGFIEKDDVNDPRIQRYKNAINSKLSRNNYRGNYLNDSESSDMEVPFDRIQNEEYRSQKIAEIEDYEEELREKRQTKNKYSH